MKPLHHCIFLLFVVELFFSRSHSLKCRGEDDEEDEDFNEVARMCMRNTSNWDRPSNNKNRYSTRNNDNNRKYGNHASNNGNGCGESNNNDNSWGGSKSNRNNNNYDTSYGSSSNSENNNNGNKRGRNSDSGNSWSYGGGWQQSPSNRGFTQYGGSDSYSSYRNNENNSDRSRNNNHSMDFYGNSPLESIEPCIIHCIFSEMEMLDDEGLPEKTSVKNIMTRKIRNSEVRAFIADSIEECYDLLDAENKREKCEYSKSLALCLEEKGRRTCEDWDAADRKNKNGR